MTVLMTTTFLIGSGLVPVDNVEGEHGMYSTGDMITMQEAMRPRVTGEMQAMFGEPMQISRDLTGWAFAFEGDADFGVLLEVHGHVTLLKAWARVIDAQREWAVREAYKQELSEFLGRL